MLRDAEFGLCKDTKELFIGNGGENIPVLTLKRAAGGALGIDTTAEEDSANLVTGGAVYAAVQTVMEELRLLADRVNALEQSASGGEV